MPRAVIVSNGIIHDHSYYTQKLCDSDFVICADGGVNHLLKIGRLPDLWIGDFDSCRFSDVISANPGLEKVDTVKLNCDKDVTDTHYACLMAIERGYGDIVIWGAFGGRVDHMLSIIHLLEFLNDKGITAVIEDEKNTLRLCSDTITISKKRKYLSIIPLDSSCIIAKTEGLKYPLENYELPRSVSKGISNEITGTDALISVKFGLALIVESDD